MGSEGAVRRGDVVWVRLGPVEGSGQGERRPALVLSPDLVNQHSPVVIAAAITAKKTSRVYPFEALLLPSESGLSATSKVLLLQIRSLDKSRIEGRAGHLEPGTMLKVNEALKVATGMVDL